MEKNKYNLQSIKPKWGAFWKKVFQPNLKTAQRPFYNLMMFPYPSAEGLHVGNMYAFTGSDIYGRFMKLQGYDLFEPIGLDGFGIHSENYAIQKNTHPAKMAEITKKNFYRQLEATGNAYAWDNTLETYDPEYYKWTQWIFVQMFKKGLAYRAKAPVNWCPSCKTVLADEQTETGVCERCKTKVVKKELEQWFFRITDYADRLVADLVDLDWSEKVKIAQKNWIGRSQGALIKFQITNSKLQINLKSQISNSKLFVEVFTTRPDTLYGATYLVLAPEHPLIANRSSLIANRKEIEAYIKKIKNNTEINRIKEGKEKTGIELKGVKAINPANNKEIPICIADYVLTTYGTGAIMAVPAHDERDYEFAKKYKLPVIEVIKSIGSSLPYTGEGKLTNSGKFNGLDLEKAREVITKFVGGKKTIHYKLRDWLISRQRYWGPPIPVIYCRKCWERKATSEQRKVHEGIDFVVINDQEYAIISVPEEDLPVKLPETENWRPKGTGQSPLANIPEFVNTKCPKCGGPAERETDVSDTFLDSSWYYLAYLMRGISNFQFPISKYKEVFKKWLPVDMYIGGAEHSVLHLLYVRFITYVFKEMGLIDFDSPFKKFRAHGLIIKDGAKMSKSRGNVVIPDKYIKKFGADMLRMYLMFIGPFTEGGDFRDEGIVGIKRFLDRVRVVYHQLEDQNSRPQRLRVAMAGAANLLNNTIKKVTEDIENLRFNTAISALMILLNEIIKKPGDFSLLDYQKFLIILSPFAPHLCEELWQKLGHKESIFLERWPEAERVEKTTMLIPVMVNGKKRSLLEIETVKKLSGNEIIELALEDSNVKKWISGKKIKKTVYIPGKVVSLVI